jgi:RNA polymerase sigma-70 factor (ECF subfamily)
MKTDAELLADARTDAGAFRELYDRYAARVLGYFQRRTRDEDAAHDLTAETFAQAWLSRSRFRDEAGGSAGPWIFAIASHVLRASVRRGRVERSACQRLGVAERLDGVATTEPEESWLDGVDDALADLPETQREAIQLRVIDDLAYEQVACALDVTPEAARVRVHRGLRTLRAKLSNAKETPR